MPSRCLFWIGLVGNWADDCNGHQRVHLRVAAPPAGPSSFDSVTIDEGVKTTLRSVVLSAERLPPGRLKLRTAVCVHSPATNIFEQTFENLAGGGLPMIGNPPIPLKGCHD
jgi:hypothetical protein